MPIIPSSIESKGRRIPKRSSKSRQPDIVMKSNADIHLKALGQKLECAINKQTEALIELANKPEIFLNAVTSTTIDPVNNVFLVDFELNDGTTFQLDLSALFDEMDQTLSVNSATGDLTISGLGGNTVNICSLVVSCMLNNGLPHGIDILGIEGTQIKTGDEITFQVNGENFEILSNGVVVSSDSLCPAVQQCISTNGIPAGVDLYTQDGTVVKTGDVRNTTNTLSATGNVLTSTVNGVADSYDLTSILGNAILTTQDDQVLTADANSVMDIQLTPTTTTPDPDGQGSRTDYTVSSTIKPTYIKSGNAVSPTNKVLTEDAIEVNPDVTERDVITTADRVLIPQQYFEQEVIIPETYEQYAEATLEANGWAKITGGERETFRLTINESMPPVPFAAPSGHKWIITGYVKGGHGNDDVNSDYYFRTRVNGNNGYNTMSISNQHDSVGSDVQAFVHMDYTPTINIIQEFQRVISVSMTMNVDEDRIAVYRAAYLTLKLVRS